MEVTREGVLCCGVAAVAARFVPLNLPNAGSEFDPTKEYGNTLLLEQDGPTTYEHVPWELVDLLRKDMEKHVPKNYRSAVVMLFRGPMDYGRRRDLSWYYTPKARRVTY